MMLVRAPRRIASVAALLLSLIASERTAAPQPAAPPQNSATSVPKVVPPRPLEELRADYPAGAQGDARVIVVVVVNADGSVRSAKAAEGEEPFASAAVARASSFRFEPATRDGKPIAAAIRIEIRFTAPAPEPPRDAPSSAPPPALGSASAAAKPAAPPPAAPQPIDVTVRGEALAPGVTSLSRAEVRLLPGAFGDPFRAVETLPGVTPLASGLPYFYVRGAPPGNVGYFLDGIRVPLLYHLGLGPSVVHPAIVDRVDLYPGGYPARYGNFAGGIVAGETKPPLDVWHGEGVLRLVDAGALVEAPFAGGRAKALIAGRYSYTALLLSLIQSEVKLDYWDYQGRFSFDVTPRDTITVFGFGSRDYLGSRRSCNNSDDPLEKPECFPLTGPDGARAQTIDTFFDTTFHRLDLRYTHRTRSEGTLLQAITLGFDQTGLQEGSFARDLMIGSRTEILHRLGGDILVRAGYSATFDHVTTDLTTGPDPGGLNALFSTSQRDLVTGLYAQITFPVTRRLEITPGLRLDLYGEAIDGKESANQTGANATAIGIDPRLSSRFTVTRSFRLTSAIGIATQPPSFILPGPGFRVGLEGGVQRSFQASAGVEADLPGDVTTTVTLFQNALFNLTDALGTVSQADGFNDNFKSRSLGHSLGLELTVHRRLTRRVGGFLAYTLSRSTRSFNRTTRPSSFDRTHVFNMAISNDFGRGYRAGTRVVFYTGIPSNYQPDAETVRRLPPFFRFDARLEKRWPIGQTGWLSVVLEGLNVMLGKEALGENCTPGRGCSPQRIGPISIPSLGLEGGF